MQYYASIERSVGILCFATEYNELFRQYHENKHCINGPVNTLDLAT